MCGSKSSSTSSPTTGSYNQDKSVTLAAGGLGVSGDRNAISITTNTTTTDAGVVDRAFDSIDITNAAASDGFNKLLSAAEKMFITSSDNSSKLAGQVQQSVAAAYSDAQNNAKGTIDNRTMIVLVVAGAAALVFVKRKG